MKESAPPLGRGRLRLLSEEEIALWLAVAKTVAPRPGSILPQPAKPKRAPSLSAPVGPKALASAPAVANGSPKKAAAPARAKVPPLEPIERRLRQKLSRGRLSPDAAIDLHGMRRHEASGALHQFLARAQQEGAKIVLVVTGKGRGGGADEDEPGVLRRSVPQWLRGPDYRAIVVGFEEASRPHGGSGALYIRIRRRRPPHD